MHSRPAALLLSLPVLALGQTIHDVQVGAGGLVFQPDTVNAAVNDQVRFTFGQIEHSVAQATFDAPCRPKDAGFYSGYQQGRSTTFTITVNDTNAIWVYCSVAQHCQAGMEMVINPMAQSDTSLANFKAAAGRATNNISPANSNAVGGVLSTSSGNSTSGSNSTSTTSSSSSSSTGGSSGSSNSSSSSTESSSGSSPTDSSGSSGSGSSSGSSSSAGATPTGNAAAGMVPTLGGAFLGLLAVAGLA